MKIYYNSSLWSKAQGPHGLPQRVNWQFEYDGTRRCIPVIYRFPEGIVFDVITFLDEAKLRKFFEKYEADEGNLTPLQRRCAEQEHPYQAVPINEIWINGRRVESGYSFSSTVNIPWAHQDDAIMLVRKAYSFILKDTVCFACQRFCVPYPKANSGFEKLLRFLRLEKVNHIKILTNPLQWFWPLNINFEIPAKEEKVISFKHPVTGITHILYFQDAENVEISHGTSRDRSIYYLQAMYEIDPALPAGDSLQFNSSIRYTEQSDDKFMPKAASSIGIIGGADGPTAIFVAANDKGKVVPCGLHGLPLHCCFSVPAFRKEDLSQFVLEGINAKYYESREYNFE